MATTSAFAFETILATDKPQLLTKSIYAPTDGHAEIAFVTVEGDIKMRYDGGDPTEVEGHHLRDGSFFKLMGQLQIEKFKFVALRSVGSNIAVTYERT